MSSETLSLCHLDRSRISLSGTTAESACPEVKPKESRGGLHHHAVGRHFGQESSRRNFRVLNFATSSIAEKPPMRHRQAATFGISPLRLVPLRVTPAPVCTESSGRGETHPESLRSASEQGEGPAPPLRRGSQGEYEDYPPRALRFSLY